MQKKNGHLTVSVLGTPEGTRTPDLLVRSQTLYPTELLARFAVVSLTPQRRLPIYNIMGQGWCQHFSAKTLNFF